MSSLEMECKMQLNKVWYRVRILGSQWHTLAHKKRVPPTRLYIQLLHLADTTAMLILSPGHPIMIIEINIFLHEQLISMFIMGLPQGQKQYGCIL